MIYRLGRKSGSCICDDADSADRSAVIRASIGVNALLGHLWHLWRPFGRLGSQCAVPSGGLWVRKVGDFYRLDPFRSTDHHPPTTLIGSLKPAMLITKT